MSYSMIEEAFKEIKDKKSEKKAGSSADGGDKNFKDKFAPIEIF